MDFPCWVCFVDEKLCRTERQGQQPIVFVSIDQEKPTWIMKTKLRQRAHAYLGLCMHEPVFRNSEDNSRSEEEKKPDRRFVFHSSISQAMVTE